MKRNNNSRSKHKRESPSKRLRNIIFSHFNHDSEGYEEFDDYYVDKMDGIIEMVGGKLESKKKELLSKTK